MTRLISDSSPLNSGCFCPCTQTDAFVHSATSTVASASVPPAPWKTRLREAGANRPAPHCDLVAPVLTGGFSPSISSTRLATVAGVRRVRVSDRCRSGYRSETATARTPDGIRSPCAAAPPQLQASRPNTTAKDNHRRVMLCATRGEGKLLVAVLTTIRRRYYVAPGGRHSSRASKQRFVRRPSGLGTVTYSCSDSR